MGLTSDSRNGMLNHIFRNKTMESPSEVYIALFTSNGEVDGTGYDRQPISFGEPEGGKMENDEEVRFGFAGSDWGEIKDAGIYDKQTGGTRLDNAKIANVKLMEENDQFSIPEGNYIIEVD